MTTLYTNNEILGNEPYIGTRDEWRKLISDPKGWAWYLYSETTNAYDYDGDKITFEEFINDLLDRGLEVARGEEIARYERV